MTKTQKNILYQLQQAGRKVVVIDAEAELKARLLFETGEMLRKETIKFLKSRASANDTNL